MPGLRFAERSHMRKKEGVVRAPLLLVLAAAIVTGCMHAPGHSPRSVVLGVTHTGGTYNLGNTQQDFLSQGADEVLALGSRSIKLWFHRPGECYPFNSQWPEHFDSLVDMAKHPYYRAVFDKPFKTYFLVAYGLGRPEHYWAQGISEAEQADEQRQFHEFARYLLTTYRNTGKTFILQHWEGDWAIRGAYDPNIDPTPTAINGMIAWLNARQAGVEQARKEVGEHGVHVYHAAEVNLVAKSMNAGKPNVVNAVLPHTHLDLVSYSSWDTLSNGPGFRRALDFIAANMPDSPAFGAKNVYIGEYGFPENETTAEKYQANIRNVVETGLDWACPYIVYWELFCNEARHKPVTKNEDVRGLWLIKPDGSKAWAWDYLHAKISEAP